MHPIRRYISVSSRTPACWAKIHEPLGLSIIDVRHRQHILLLLILHPVESTNDFGPYLTTILVLYKFLHNQSLLRTRRKVPRYLPLCFAYNTQPKGRLIRTLMVWHVVHGRVLHWCASSCNKSNAVYWINLATSDNKTESDSASLNCSPPC